MKAYREMVIKLHSFLTSVVSGDGLSAPRSAHFNPRERSAGAHGIGGWVAPRATLDVATKGERQAMQV
jgi:hypothetical protein